MTEFFEILSAECAVDDAVVTAHRDRHAMAHGDVIAIIDYWNFRNLADREAETLRRIDDGGKAVDAHTTEIGDGECATLKFLRLHSLVARAMRQIFHQLADLPQRFILRGTNDGRQQPILNRNRNSKIDIGVLHNRVSIE